MNIRKVGLKVRSYYAVCNNCNKSIDSNEKYMYDGLCRFCYYNRY